MALDALGYSQAEIEQIEAKAKQAGAPGLLWARRSEDGTSGPLGKFLSPGQPEAIGLGVGDLVLAAAGPDTMTSPALAAARPDPRGAGPAGGRVAAGRAAHQRGLDLHHLER